MTPMSTELIEESIADVGPRSVGLVRTQSATLFAPPHELTLANSRRLGPITVAYETYGTLSPRTRQRDFRLPRPHRRLRHTAGYRSKEDFAAQSRLVGRLHWPG